MYYSMNLSPRPSTQTAFKQIYRGHLALISCFSISPESRRERQMLVYELKPVKRWTSWTIMYRSVTTPLRLKTPYFIERLVMLIRYDIGWISQYLWILIKLLSWLVRPTKNRFTPFCQKCGVMAKCEFLVVVTNECGYSHCENGSHPMVYLTWISTMVIISSSLKVY